MKIAIYTQPLRNNYGGLLQNFALQQVLEKNGCSVVTIDYDTKHIVAPLWLCILSWIKNILLFLFFRRKPKFFKYPTYLKRKEWSEQFVRTHIKTTAPCQRPSISLLEKNCIDTIIVGSDQVWRPTMNLHLDDCFLRFASKKHFNRIAYAASFGTSKWEMTPKQTTFSARLAQKFSAISVREKSGVTLCKKYLKVNADFVLDPTLLLSVKDYYKVCKDVPTANKKYLVAYILDTTSEIQNYCEKIAQEKGLTVKYFSSDENSFLTIPEWLAMFRDASYVVTDSFHGTVFSIIFEKEFKCIYNEARGAARFESLLNLYNSGKLDEMRQFSLNWLKKALDPKCPSPKLK